MSLSVLRLVMGFVFLLVFLLVIEFPQEFW